MLASSWVTQYWVLFEEIRVLHVIPELHDCLNQESLKLLNYTLAAHVVCSQVDVSKTRNIVVISNKSFFEQLPVMAADGSKPQLANKAYPP